MIDKKILTIIILALISTILVTIMVVDYVVDRELDNIKDAQLEQLNKLKNDTLQFQLEKEDILLKIVDGLNGPNTTIVNEGMTQNELNVVLLDVMNSFMRQNSEQYDVWQSQLDILMEEIQNRDYVRKTVYINSGGVS